MTLDAAQRRSTAFVCVLIFVVLSVFTAAFPVAAVAEAIAAFSVGALALSWAMSPCALVVDDTYVLVERRAWAPLRIARASIASASPVNPYGPGIVRLFGNAGFFGNFGLFRNDALGRFRLYATHSRQAVLLRRVSGELPIVVTPDDVAGTIGAIDRRPEA